MPDTIKLPIFGAQKSKTVYLVGGGVVLLLGVAYYRHRTGTANAPVDPATVTDDSQIDPATGFSYGSADDAAALAASSAYVSGTDAGGGGGPATGGTTVTGFTSNPQWENAAIDYLVNTVSLDGPTVSAALGKYLAGAGVTDGEKSLIEQAIASEGLPPVGGTNGFPPSIQHITGPVAPVVPAGGLTAPRLSVTYTPGTNARVSLSWTASAGAAKYDVYYNGHYLTYTTGLKINVPFNPGYKYTIKAVNGGVVSAASNTIVIKKA